MVELHSDTQQLPRSRFSIFTGRMHVSPALRLFLWLSIIPNVGIFFLYFSAVREQCGGSIEVLLGRVLVYLILVGPPVASAVVVLANRRLGWWILLPYALYLSVRCVLSLPQVLATPIPGKALGSAGWLASTVVQAGLALLLVLNHPFRAKHDQAVAELSSLRRRVLMVSLTAVICLATTVLILWPVFVVQFGSPRNAVTANPGVPQSIDAVAPAHPVDGHHEAVPIHVTVSQDPPGSYGRFMAIADKMRRSGRRADSLTASESAELPKGSRAALPFAMRYLERGVPAVMPLARWAVSIPSDRQLGMAEGSVNRSALYGLARAIERTGGRSLAGSFYIAALLIVPVDDAHNRTEIEELTRRLGTDTSSDGMISGVTEADRTALWRVLSRYRLSGMALGQACTYLTLSWFREWVQTLAGTQTDSAGGTLMALNLAVQKSDRREVRRLITQLAGATDWTWDWAADSVMLARELQQRWMRGEAIELLEIVSRRSNDQGSPAAVELSKLTGRPPTQPQGAEALVSSRWLATASANQILGRTTDARICALQALRIGRDPREEVGALKILAEVDPEGALRPASELLQGLLAVDPRSRKRIGEHSCLVTNSDSPLRELSGVLCTMARRVRGIAPQIAPLLDRAAGYDTNTRLGLSRDRALVHIWAGNTGVAANILFRAGDVTGAPIDARAPMTMPQSFDDSRVLEASFSVLLNGDVSDQARITVVGGLKRFLAKRNPTPETIDEVLRSMHELNVSADAPRLAGKLPMPGGDTVALSGVKALSSTLLRYVSGTHATSPEITKLRALAGMPFPKSARVGGSPDDAVPYTGARQTGRTVKGTDSLGRYTTTRYAVSAGLETVVSFYRDIGLESRSLVSASTSSNSGDIRMRFQGYLVKIHLQSKGENHTEFTITKYGV